MSASVMYVSYTGVLEPLGESQVLQYVLGLASHHSIILLSFESSAALADRDRVAAIERQCAEGGVSWKWLEAQGRPAALGRMIDLARGVSEARRVARDAGVDILHARSYIAGLVGLAVKRSLGVRFLFDMRGFWPDERVEGRIWNQGGLFHRIFKHAERRLFLGADHVVSLTRAGVRELERFDYLMGRVPPSTVIPTCTNLESFRLRERDQRSGFTLGYVGSVGSWYLFDEVAAAVRRLFDARVDARFLVVNKGGHEFVRAALGRAGVDPARVEIREEPYARVPEQIARMDAGIFFIRPAWSKRASCPTRMGEFLACGKPCLANAGVGDVAEDLRETGTGVAVGDFESETIDAALVDLQRMAADPEVGLRCRAAAERRFSLAAGVRAYSEIYKQLARTGHVAAA